MRVRVKITIPVVVLALLVSLLSLAPVRASAEVVDRIVATVNGRIILQSDWDEALYYEALLTNRTVGQFTDDDRRAVLDRLIDQDLLARVRQQIDVMRLVEARLRPAVQIDSKSIEAYYRNQFVPKLKQSGASEVPLAEVSAKIRELLTEQKVSELLVSWLQTLRSEGQVRIPGVTSSANDPGVQSR